MLYIWVDGAAASRSNQSPRERLFCRLFAAGFAAIACDNCANETVTRACHESLSSDADRVESEAAESDRRDSQMAWTGRRWVVDPRKPSHEQCFLSVKLDGKSLDLAIDPDLPAQIAISEAFDHIDMAHYPRISTDAIVEAVIAKWDMCARARNATS